jgi:hypothetical protein
VERQPLSNAVAKNVMATEVYKTRPNQAKHVNFGANKLHINILVPHRNIQKQVYKVTSAEILMERLLSGATPQTKRRDGNIVLQLVERQFLLLEARKPLPQPQPKVERQSLLEAEEAEAGSGDGKLSTVRESDTESPLGAEVEEPEAEEAEAGSGVGKLLTVRESDTESPLAAEAGNGVGKL